LGDDRLLTRIVSRQAPHGVHPLGHRAHGLGVGLQVTVAPRQQKSSLAGLRVLRCRENRIDGDQNVVGLNDPLVVLPKALDVGVGDHARHQEEA